MSLRYLFDEHLRGTLPEVVRRVARQGIAIEVLEVDDSAEVPLGAQDPEIIRWAEANEYVLVSHDIKTLPSHLAAHVAGGRQSPGIFIVHEPLNFELAEWLVLMAVATDPGEWRNRIAFVP